jgi:hypothetical protein
MLRQANSEGDDAWPAGVRESNFNDRAFSMLVLAPSRTVAVYAKIPENGAGAPPVPAEAAAA